MRFVTAIVLVVGTALLVYLERDGYRDNVNQDGLSLLDCFYYVVVTLSTTGYGDVTPVSDTARLVNVVVVTPARVLFLAILVGTTLEVLTEQYRTNLRLTRWRKTVKDHVIVCGYGTKGRCAIAALLETGFPKERIVVVDRDPGVVRQATSNGLAAIEGSATRADVLREARVHDAQAVIVATDSDESAVLITLTVRQMTAGKVRITTAARETDNVPLLKQSGAHNVILSSATTGRMLGVSTSAPPLIEVVEDLLTPGHGMALAIRSASRDEVGRPPRELSQLVIALVRRGEVVSIAEPDGIVVETGDLLVYVRDTGAQDGATTVF